MFKFILPKKQPWWDTDLASIGKSFSRLIKIRLFRYMIVFSFLAVTIPAILFLIFKPKPLDNITFGLNFSHKYAQDLGLDWKNAYLTILDEFQPKEIRLVLYWDEIERNKDTYDYSVIKYQLDEAKKRDVKVIATMGRKVLRYPECWEPEWWKQLKDEQVQDFELYEYIKQSVTELKGYDNIFMWQVENEPFFPFGTCKASRRSVIEKEISIVKNLDSRPILVQDSGEGGFWLPSYTLGDYLGISMYRRIWYDFWGMFFGQFVYFQYPLANWTYKIKANITGVPVDKIIVTELQGEPWGPGINSKLSREEKDKTMSRRDFIDTINYAQNTGFAKLYFWGPEWWLFEREKLGNSFYWDTAKALFK